MTIRERYIWGKTSRGYGWQGWTDPHLSLEKNGHTGNWEVYEADGSLLCRCVTYRDAQRVAARLRHLIRAQVTPDAVPEFAYIAEGSKGWVVHHVSILEDFGETFSTLEAAEAYIARSDLVSQGWGCPEARFRLKSEESVQGLSQENFRGTGNTGPVPPRPIWRVRRGDEMAKRGKEQSVPVSISLPKPVYDLLEYAAHQKEIAVSDHIRAWILGSLAPWEADLPLPLDAVEVIELPDEGEASGAPLPEHKPVDTSLRREDFDSTEAYLKAEKADQIARGLATRKKNREAKPKVMAGHIRAIAEARKAHPTLSLRKFSQFLFDEGVYKSYGWDAQKAKPVNSAILPVWLKQAREAGLLPQKALPKRTPKTPKVTYPRKPDPRP